MLGAADRLDEPADRRRSCRRRRRRSPVHAELGGLVGVDLDDDRLDQHLRAADVELSMTLISERIVLGGAVMTSALVSGSAQMVVLLVGDRRRRRAGGAPAAAAGAGDLFLELGGDLLGIGVAQVAHLRVAAVVERRVEVGDQRLGAQPLRLARR